MKLIKSMKELIVIQMNPYQAHIYINIHMIRSAYFGHGILELNKKQEKELRLIYEELLLKKLGLGEKFLRLLLCVRKLAGRVRLLQLKTIVGMMVIKQHITNNRMKNRVYSIIKTNKEWISIESGYSLHLLRMKDSD